LRGKKNSAGVALWGYLIDCHLYSVRSISQFLAVLVPVPADVLFSALALEMVAAIALNP